MRPATQTSTQRSIVARNRWRPGSKSPLKAWSINVLVVDDDLGDASVILSVLRRHPEVASAQAIGEPEIALDQLASGLLQPDLILLDINMPRINGFRFVEQLRQIPARLDTPVVFLTTSRLASEVQAARDTSVILYVVKPDTMTELQTRLDGAIKRVTLGARS